MNFMPLILLLVFFVLNIPIAFSLIMAVLYYFLFCNDTLAPYMIFQKMVSQGESFTLLAVPFFVAVGVIMNYSGIATRLMNVADMLTGQHGRRPCPVQCGTQRADGRRIRLRQCRCGYGSKDAGA